MTLDSLDVVFYTAIFIMPGFVVNGVINKMNPPRKYNESYFFLKCIGYSIVSCAIWSWLYQLVIQCDELDSGLRWVLLVAISLIGSTLVGVCISIFMQKELIDKILIKLKLRTVHGTLTAWDYVFSQQASGYVIVTLIDGTRHFGWYSGNSFTSSDPDERDIYVEKAFDDQWRPDEYSAGFYIPKDQIKSIEFKIGGQKNVKNTAKLK